MTAPVFEHVRLDRVGDVSVLTIDRAERMNAVTAQTFRELGAAARLVAHDGTRALVVTGAGDRAFCAGYDLAEVPRLREASVPAFLDIEDDASGAVAALAALPFPVVAALNGAASGGGLSIALAADVRLAAPHVTLNAAFVRVGFSVGELGTSWVLTRLVGPGLAAELSFTGRLVRADEAVAIGLVTRVVADDVLEAALALATDLASATGRVGKRTLRRAQETASLVAAVEADLPERSAVDGWGA